MTDRPLEPAARRAATNVHHDDPGQPREEEPVGITLAPEEAADEACHLAAAAESHRVAGTVEDSAERRAAVDERLRGSVEDEVRIAVRQHDDVARGDGKIRHAVEPDGRSALGDEMIVDQPLGARRQQVGDPPHGRYGEAPGGRALGAEEDRAGHSNRGQRLGQRVHPSLRCTIRTFRTTGPRQSHPDSRQSLQHLLGVGSCSTLTAGVRMMTRRERIEQRVAQHYAQDRLTRRIVAALVASGTNPDRLSPADLAPIDEFHTGGREATAALAARMTIGLDTHLLDVGCGIGGAARYIAETYRCRVTGIDLTEEFVRTAEALTRLVDLEAQTTFRHASALAMPFENGCFDGAYMLHVGMNVEDKPLLFSEVRRVLKGGGTFAIYDVMLAREEELRFPLPCAATPETSFVVPASAYRRALDGAGFDVVSERDHSELAASFFRRQAALGDEAGGPPI